MDFHQHFSNKAIHGSPVDRHMILDLEFEFSKLKAKGRASNVSM